MKGTLGRTRYIDSEETKKKRLRRNGNVSYFMKIEEHFLLINKVHSLRTYIMLLPFSVLLFGQTFCRFVLLERRYVTLNFTDCFSAKRHYYQTVWFSVMHLRTARFCRTEPYASSNELKNPTT